MGVGCVLCILLELRGLYSASQSLIQGPHVEREGWVTPCLCSQADEIMPLHFYHPKAPSTGSPRLLMEHKQSLSFPLLYQLPFI